MFYFSLDMGMAAQYKAGAALFQNKEGIGNRGKQLFSVAGRRTVAERDGSHFIRH